MAGYLIRRRLSIVCALAAGIAIVPPSAGAQAAKPATPATPQAQATPATVKSITRTALPRGDRITIEFTRDVTYVSDRVPNPDRLYFDFNKATLTTLAADRAQAVTSPLVKRIRLGQFSATSLRLVIELTGSPRYSAFVLYSPFRLVVDLEQGALPDVVSPIVKASAPTRIETAARPGASSNPASTPVTSKPPTPALPPPPPVPLSVIEVPKDDIPADSFSLPGKVTTDVSDVLRAGKPVALAVPAAAANTSKGNYSLGRQLGLGISRIVIDPGHGGRDPGAQANSIDEAELVLDVALRLEALLKTQAGIDVVMTRRTDQYVPLEERTAIANREGADLFLSIHANAATDPTLRGIETYFLNFASNPTAEAVAARENATSAKTMGNLPELVKAITLNNKVAESREFAGIVQTSMTQELGVKNKTIRDLGVKQAAFVVLIGAQMPSVLAEISFVTNKPEATFLKQAAYRQGIAQALFDAVTKYQGSLKRSSSGAATMPKGGDPR